MPHDPKKLLHDMSQAAERVARFVGKRTFEEFVADDYFRSAVERQFEIIGEALVRLRKLDSEIASRISNHKQIAGFRNALIHDYDGVDDRITWNIILKHLPVLRAELDKIMERKSGG
jgi:uncharacterized protein with HEPN domain